MNNYNKSIEIAKNLENEKICPFVYVLLESGYSEEIIIKYFMYWDCFSGLEGVWDNPFKYSFSESFFTTTATIVSDVVAFLEYGDV